ncbi:MAG TPA: DddA-like double-stranded DNA deaminase toxin [Pseudonocardiaceae bacterium]|nr:DddA-like double-stranded DNA deaminase toxin [Pseudonocardiaceae bacterium]
MLEQLPPAVPRPNVEGKKTHGRWVDEHGQAKPIVSGRDEDSAEVWRILQERGIRLPFAPTTVTDVEQKLAARMVREGRRELSVVLNNRPCRGQYSCNTLVPAILPEGYALTVHGPGGYRKTFTGGATL